MAEINSFASTSKSYILNIDNITYVAYVDADENKALETLGAVKSTDNNTIIYNLYPLSTLSFQGIAARQHRYPYKDHDDYQYSYTPKLPTQFISCIQANDTIYGLRGKSTKGHCYVNETLFDWLAHDNGYAFPHCHEIQTHLYKVDEIPESPSTYKLLDDVSTVIGDVQYNSLYEIPGNQPNDYSSGTLFATTVKTKNQYDARYDMSGKLSPNANTSLLDSRSYIGIHKCNDQIYLTYTVNTQNKYRGLREITVPSVNFTTNSLTANKFTYYSTTSAEGGTSSPFPQIEVIENINRGISQIQHKTSLYSLELNAPVINGVNLTKINENNDKQKIKDNIRQEIKNCIRKFAEKLAPANSQLFSVNIK